MNFSQRKALYTYGLNDFKKSIRSLKSENLKDYLDMTVAYVLRHNLGGNAPKMSVLRNVIFEAQKQISINIGKRQMANNPKDLTNMQYKDEGEVKYFLTDPVGYINLKLNDEEYYDSIVQRNITSLKDKLKDNDVINYTKALNKSKEKLCAVIGTEAFKIQYTGTQNKDMYTDDILDLLGEKMPNTTIRAELHRARPTFWEKVLFRTSSQWKAFKRTLWEFTGIHDAGRDDRKGLEDTAMAYLRRKFPNLKEDELPTLEQINRLDEKSKIRATLCYNVAKSCLEVRQSEKLVKAVRELKLDLNDIKKNDIEDEKELEINTNVIKKQKVAENDYIIKKGVTKKSNLKVSLPDDNNTNQKAKKKKHIKFNVGKTAPKRYVKEGRVIGGDKHIPRLPEELQDKHQYQQYPMTSEEGILELEGLKKSIEAEEAAKKVVAPDNNEFVKELKNEVEDKAVESTEISTSSNTNVLENNNEIKEIEND